MREPACMAHELDQLLKDVAFTRLLGLRLKDMSAGRCTLEVPFQETFERPDAVRPRSSSLELTSPRSDLTSQTAEVDADPTRIGWRRWSPFGCCGRRVGRLRWR